MSHAVQLVNGHAMPARTVVVPAMPAPSAASAGPATVSISSPSPAVDPERGGRVRIWVDDHHAIFRRGLLACLTGDDFHVVGESAALNPAPDPTAIDMLMFQADRAALRRTVSLTRDHAVDLVAIIDVPSDELVHEAINAGVSCVLLRPQLSPRKVVGSLRAVAEGNACIPADLMSRLLVQAARGSHADPGTLTPRERRILTLLASGSDTRDIAGQLNYSERTVKNVVHDTLVKMNCTNRTHAVAVAIRQGVI